MSTRPLPVRHVHAGVLRTGLVFAAILGVLDIVGGIVQLTASDAMLPVAVAGATLLAGAATLILVPFAWRGRRRAAWTVAGLRLGSALTALPAFFVAGVPVAAVVAAATGILLAVAVAVLIAFGLEARR